jgi:hypothetical protein
MSQAQPSPTSSPSSQPSLPTSSEAAQTGQHSLRFAEGDQDICLIHQFLLIVAQPALRCKVNFLKSLEEVARIARSGAALMLFEGDVLIGTMGLMSATWWYGDGEFLTDRWHFVLPSHDGTAAAQSLIDEAVRIAKAADLDFIHQGRMRERRPGAYFMWPRVSSAGG